MSADTKTWLYLLADMLVVAETMTAYSSLPLGMTRVTRNGILYLVASFKSVNYLLAAKSNFVS
jgi:hypothetical protein